MKRKYSNKEKKERFIEFWTDPSNTDTFGNVTAAKIAAGYAAAYSNQALLRSMPDEVIEAVNTYNISASMKAASAIVDVLNDPSQLGAANRLKAADSILDRSGIVKKSQVEVKSDQPASIFFLPAKDALVEEDTDE